MLLAVCLTAGDPTNGMVQAMALIKTTTLTRSAEFISTHAGDGSGRIAQSETFGLWQVRWDFSSAVQKPGGDVD
jgi:predicted hydrolase (HD superfamily)